MKCIDEQRGGSVGRGGQRKSGRSSRFSILSRSHYTDQRPVTSLLFDEDDDHASLTLGPQLQPRRVVVRALCIQALQMQMAKSRLTASCPTSSNLAAHRRGRRQNIQGRSRRAPRLVHFVCHVLDGTCFRLCWSIRDRWPLPSDLAMCHVDHHSRCASSLRQSNVGCLFRSLTGLTLLLAAGSTRDFVALPNDPFEGCSATASLRKRVLVGTLSHFKRYVVPTTTTTLSLICFTQPSSNPMRLASSVPFDHHHQDSSSFLVLCQTAVQHVSSDSRWCPRQPFAHAAQALASFCNFTSPIRRCREIS